MDEIALHLLQLLLAEATSPAVKKWALMQLKSIEENIPNPLFKAVLQAIEAFLSAAA